MEKSYNECVELEALSPLISPSNEIVSGVLLFLVAKLRHIMPDSYNFEVISYGFQGSYPVIGVEYADDNQDSVEEHIIDEYKKIIVTNDIASFINFLIKEKPKIDEVMKQLASNSLS